MKPLTKGPAKTLREAHVRLDKTLINHRRFDECSTTLRARMLFQGESKLMIVVGPSGSGKTRAMLSAQKTITGLMQEELLDDHGRIPSVAFEVGATSIGNFAWGPFYHQYLAQLQVPLNPSREVMMEMGLAPKEHGPHQVLISAVKHRRPHVVLLDEANHLCQVSNPRLIAQQLNKIKSLANTTGVLHILFGTYELAGLLDASSQLARRAEVFHFARYRPHVAGEMGHFSTMVKQFQKVLPFHHTIDLSSNMDFIYERTIGCCGILKNWLVQAMAQACRNDRDHITFDDMVQTAMEANKLRRLLLDAQRGEELLDDRSSSVETLRQMIWNPQGEQGALALAGVGAKTKTEKRNPGERAPSSDPVGGAFRQGCAIEEAV